MGPFSDNERQGNPVIRNCAQCLVHVPDLVRFGSKPTRDRDKDPDVVESMAQHLRSFDDAVRYPPNQAFIGGITPEELASITRPWYRGDIPEMTEKSSTGSFGEIIPQRLFYSVLHAADVLKPPLVELAGDYLSELDSILADHPVLKPFAGKEHTPSVPSDAADSTSLTLYEDDKRLGLIHRDNRAEGREDRNLDAPTLLEGLATKASGAIALRWLLHREALAPETVDFVISCGEEAAGDRYQRGAGGMAKSIAEMCGCNEASGMDVKNFCAGPASAIVTAGALVKSGLYRRVVVVAGGSLAKLGMKYPAFVKQGMPVLDDCLGALAILVTPDDGVSPVLRLDPGTVGIAKIGASTSDEAVYRGLVLDPLEALDLTMNNVDRYAPELHNPEIMEHSGSGDVVHKNYRMLAALAVRSGTITKADMASFIDRTGMVGFAPTQGHIPSAVAYLGHALEGLKSGSLHRVMFLCKASLFLNRLTELYDGVSFLLEANPGAARRRGSGV
jgi:betaine reductase